MGQPAPSPLSDRDRVREVVSAALKRRLRPLKPVLGPLWNGLRAAVGEDRRYSMPNLIERGARFAAATAKHVRGLPAPRIRALDRIELLDLAADVPYYKARRGYLGAAGVIAAELIARRGLQTALELGPHLRSLIVGADVMDIATPADRTYEGRLIVHNATQVPWPVANKAYDLFVAFQVFEHLGTHQAAAFREARRVARHAILSLPIDWEMADPANCHHRITEDTVLGWFAPVVPTRIALGNPGHRKRLLFVFEDLPEPCSMAGDRRPPA